MSVFRTLIVCALLTLSCTGTALAEGFSMTEWSARGLGLAGGMIGRADDVSTLAYNAAGITQLPGMHLMVGASFIAPFGSVSTTDPMSGQYGSTDAERKIWAAPHAYMSYQVNDSVWLGVGMFTRFGLGNTYNEGWAGRYNVYDVGMESFSVVPTVAYKFNEMFSASVGVEVMYMTMTQGTKIPMFDTSSMSLTDNDLRLQGSGTGVGVHLGLHAKFNEQWSAGLTYKSQVVQHITGTAEFAYQATDSMVSPITNMYDSNVEGTMILPDSVSFGIAYKPLDNLSFEIGTVWTRWSTYSDLNMYISGPASYDSLNKKNWNDGWNINASVEYSPLDWLTLRAGYWHETPVTDKNYSDFMMPTNGRDAMTLGVGFQWDELTLDIAYVHLWIYPTDYSTSNTSGVYGGTSSNVGADIISVSVGYSF